MGRGMKDSGIDYIGEIPIDWNVMKLKYLVECLDGQRKPVDSALRTSGIYPYWGAGSIQDYVDDYLFDEDLVLLGEDGAPFFDPYRPVAYAVSGKVWVNNHIHVLKCAKEYNRMFMVYSLNSVDYRGFINGSILNKLTQGNMREISLCCPPLYEQNRIVAFLDEKFIKIDSIIEKTRTSIEEYKHLKQAVITQAVTKGVRGNRPMKESGVEWIGKVPNEWKVGKLSYFVDSITDVDHYMPDSVDDGVPYIMTGDLRDRLSTINLDECKKVSHTDFELLAKKSKIQKGNVIFARYATIGTVCYVDIMEECIVSYSCVNILPGKSLSGLFLYYYLKSTSFSEEVQRFINSNTQGNVGIESLKHSRIVLPAFEEQQEIAAYLDEKCAEIDALIAKKEQILTELESYKKSLIYEYVTGKKTVSE